MAYIKVLKDNELIGGTDNTDVYPVTTTQAIFSQKDNGEVRLGEDGKPERLEDRLAEIEFQIELIKNGGLFIDMVLDPKSIVVEDTTDVLVKVHSSGVLSSITVYENGVSLGTEENVTDWVRTISVTPATIGDIVYEAHIVVNEGDNPIVRRSTLTVTKKQSAISWSKEVATVTMIQDYSVLPTLDTGGLVGTFTYSSSNPSVADFSNNQEYQSINFYKSNPNNPITIRVDYVDPNHVHQNASASYTLTIKKAVADVSWDVGDTFEYLTSTTEPVELYITKNSPVPLTLVYESTDNRVVIDDQQDWVRLPITTLEDSGDYEDFTVTAKIRDNVYYEDLNLPCSIRLKKVEPTFTWDRSSASITIGETPYTFPVLTNIPSDVVVRYYSTNTTVASINNSTGAINAEHLSAGSTTIVAYNDGTTKYKGHSVSYSLTVQEQQQAEVYWTVGGEKKANGYTFTYIVTNLPYQQVKFNFPSGTSFNYDVYDVSGGEYHAPISAEVTVDVNTGVATLPTETHIGYNDKYKVTAWPSTGSKANDGVSIIINPIRGERTFEWDEKSKEVYMGTLVEDEYTIPSEELPKIINGTYGEITRIEQVAGHSSPIVTIDKDNTGYTVKVTDNVVSPMEIWVRALSAMNTLYNAHADTYKLTILPPATPDYYVGWTNTVTKAELKSMTPADVAALTLDEGHAGQTYERAYGSDNTFFLLYKDGAVPPIVKLISQNTPQDINLVSDSMWVDGNGDYKGDVTIGSTAFKVFASRAPSGYDPTDSMRITL